MKKIAIVLIAIIIIMIAWIGIMLLSPNDGQINTLPNNDNPSSTVETNQFQCQYFSFEYPTNYEVIENNTSNRFLESLEIHDETDDVVAKIFIYQTTNGVLSLDGAVGSLQSLNFRNVNAQYVSLAGHSNVIEETAQFGNGNDFKGYVIQENGYILQISLFSDAGGVYAILNSFKTSF